MAGASLLQGFCSEFSSCCRRWQLFQERDEPARARLNASPPVSSGVGLLRRAPALESPGVEGTAIGPLACHCPSGLGQKSHVRPCQGRLEGINPWLGWQLLCPSHHQANHLTKPTSVSFIFFFGCKQLVSAAAVAALSPYVEGARKVTLQGKKEKAGDVFPALLMSQSGIESCQGDALAGSRMHLMNFPLLCGIITWGKEFLSTSEDALMG